MSIFFFFLFFLRAVCLYNVFFFFKENFQLQTTTHVQSVKTRQRDVLLFHTMLGFSWINSGAFGAPEISIQARARAYNFQLIKLIMYLYPRFFFFFETFESRKKSLNPKIVMKNSTKLQESSEMECLLSGGRADQT